MQVDHTVKIATGIKTGRSGDYKIINGHSLKDLPGAAMGSDRAQQRPVVALNTRTGKWYEVRHDHLSADGKRETLLSPLPGQERSIGNRLQDMSPRLEPAYQQSRPHSHEIVHVQNEQWMKPTLIAATATSAVALILATAAAANKAQQPSRPQPIIIIPHH